MKKFFLNFVILIGMCISFVSCATTVQAQGDDDVYETSSVDVSLVITNGTPFYNVDGFISYYIYDGWYYYPYLRHNRYYFRRYITPVNVNYIGAWHRPIPRHHFDRPRHRFDNHKSNVNNRHRPNVNHNNRPNINHRPGGNIHNRPSGGMNRGGNIGRPSSPNRGSTRGGGGHFGGKR